MEVDEATLGGISWITEIKSHLDERENPFRRWMRPLQLENSAKHERLLLPLLQTQGFPPSHRKQGVIPHKPTDGGGVFWQDENDDDDDWNPCKAAGVCLMLLATCCEDDIVPHVLPFIKEHIKNPDWRYRDAAVMAFGCILEGPEPNQLKPLVIQVSVWGFFGFFWEGLEVKIPWFVRGGGGWFAWDFCERKIGRVSSGFGAENPGVD